MVGESVASTMSSPRALNSWKEIAHYLGANVRTAQKWERERNLPVRRAQGARSRVSAEPAQLDHWKLQTAYTMNEEERRYCWPLGHGLTVEVRFLGGDVKEENIDLLRQYLDLFKTALRSGQR